LADYNYLNLAKTDFKILLLAKFGFSKRRSLNDMIDYSPVPPTRNHGSQWPSSLWLSP